MKNTTVFLVNAILISLLVLGAIGGITNEYIRHLIISVFIIALAIAIFIGMVWFFGKIFSKPTKAADK